MEGSRFRCGDVLLEAVKIGAGGLASDAYKGEKVCSPMEPWFVFCQIIEAGKLREGEEIKQVRLKSGYFYPFAPDHVVK